MGDSIRRFKIGLGSIVPNNTLKRTRLTVTAFAWAKGVPTYDGPLSSERYPHL